MQNYTCPTKTTKMTGLVAAVLFTIFLILVFPAGSCFGRTINDREINAPAADSNGQQKWQDAATSLRIMSSQ